jgi:hypothetical protein
VWLFIPEGFYSIVTAEEFGHDVQVRARSRADLDRLRTTYFPTLGEPVHKSGHDYPWRAFTTRQELAECLGKVALALDYSNFKDTAAHRLGHERAHTYGRVWSVCREIEHEATSQGVES